MKVMNLPLGGRLLRCGPVQSVNFPYVLLGRALYHHARIAGRTHAERGSLSLRGDTDAPNWIERQPAARRRDLERIFRALRSGEGDDLVEELTAGLVSAIAYADAPGVEPD